MTEEIKESIQYSLGKICGSIDAIREDISEIKETIIPDGSRRINEVEQKIETLTVWKKTSIALVAVLISAISWIEAKVNLIGGMFNG